MMVGTGVTRQRSELAVASENGTVWSALLKSAIRRTNTLAM